MTRQLRAPQCINTRARAYSQCKPLHSEEHSLLLYPVRGGSQFCSTGSRDRPERADTVAWRVVCAGAGSVGGGVLLDACLVFVLQGGC